jgi:hypothetical protein
MKNIRNLSVSTNLMLLFWAEAISIPDFYDPRPEVRGNSVYFRKFR